MKYEVTYDCGDGIYSANIVYAADEKAVHAYYDVIKKKPVVGIREMISPYIKPGRPVIEISKTAAEIYAEVM